MDPETGQRFGPYEILGRLGVGAMGLVYRAWDSRLHREVALKLLHRDYQMPGMRERFLQEARAASGLNHPHICTVFDLGEEEGEPYLVMELLEGQTLREKIAESALSPEEIVTYSYEIADALAAAHARGIVHRDIKPANIFLVGKPGRRYQAKVLDFGLAKIDLAMHGGRLSRALDLTLAGSTVGTLSYMSPEQARGKALDSRSDLFSLGVVMYEMATRQIPFRGSTSALIFVQLLSHAPEPVHQWNASIPRSLERVILKLLMKEKEQRYQNANELMAALDKLNLRLPSNRIPRGSDAPVPIVKAPDPVARPRRPLPPITASSRGRANFVPEADPPLEDPASSPDELPPAPSSQPEPSPAASASADHPRLFPPDEHVDAPAADSSSGLSPARQPPYLYRFRALALSLAVATIVALGAVVIFVRAIRATPIHLRGNQSVLLTTIQDHTGTPEGRSVASSGMQGLELALSPSGELNLRSATAYQAGLHQLLLQDDDQRNAVPARLVSQKVGADAYLIGRIERHGTGFTLHMDLLDTQSNELLGSLDQTVRTSPDLPGAVQGIARQILRQAGVPNSQQLRADVSLPQFEAWQAYASGELSLSRAEPLAAIAQFAQAATLDPHLVQAHLKLVRLYAHQHDDIAAAHQAQLAQEAAQDIPDDAPDARLRSLSDIANQIFGTGDLPGALRSIDLYRKAHPDDPEAALYQSEALLLQGQMAPALESAQQAYARNPYLPDAYLAAESSMLGLDRFQGVLELHAQAQRLGLVLPAGQALYAAGIAGKTVQFSSSVEQVLASTVSGHTGHLSFAGLFDYAALLDLQGRFTEAGKIWLTAASMAASQHELTSTRSALLGRAALDRSLASRCPDAMRMAASAEGLPAGTHTSFELAMAYAQCGERSAALRLQSAIRTSAPHDTRSTGYYLADIDAALALSNRDSSLALNALSTARAYAPWSLTAYLRGLAHLAQHQPLAGIPDFQAVLDHRGAAAEDIGIVYPLAEAGLVHAYQAVGDKVNAASAAHRLSDLNRMQDH